MSQIWNVHRKPIPILNWHFRLHSKMIEVVCNDRLGKKIRVKCLESDTIEDFKKMLSLQVGTPWEKIILKKGYMVFKNHITLEDYEIHNGMNLELYYS